MKNFTRIMEIIGIVGSAGMLLLGMIEFFKGNNAYAAACFSLACLARSK